MIRRNFRLPEIAVVVAFWAAGSVEAQERIPPRPLRVVSAYRGALEGGTRSESGRPGANYWQQRADYRIQAELDVVEGRLTGHEVITYHNNSPDDLEQLFIRVEQNVFAPGARRNRRAPITGGASIGSVTVNGTDVEYSHPGGGYYEALTLLQIELESPIATGSVAEIEISWQHTIPPAPTFRNGNFQGRIFAVAQWYPRVAVYDDVYGWDRAPYLGDGEFYLEYGDFDVELTVPTGWLVGATGTITNARQVLAPAAASRLEAAANSDATVRVIDVGHRESREGTNSSNDGKLTWKYHAEDVRDFAWSTSNEYVWDAARANDSVIAHAFYRPELDAWTEGVSYVTHTIRSFSAYLGDYAYPQLTITEGPVGGMEYPMLIFNPSTNNPRGLAGVTIHEGGHQWFPMMVGNMEKKHAWMDEGIISYWDEVSSAELAGSKLAPWGANQFYLAFAGTEAEVPLMRHTDLVNPHGQRGLAAYTKPAVVLGVLREVLGDDVFVAAFRDFFESWKFKHPQPWDFFNTFERHAGQDLDWFWRPLFFETDVMDHSVSVSGDRTVITIRDHGDVVLPATFVVELDEGGAIEHTVPITHWLAGNDTYVLELDGHASSVTLDPRSAFPDVDRTNNSWVRE